MTNKECQELFSKAHVENLIPALVSFAIRGSKEEATPEEVQALPGIAALIMRYSFEFVVPSFDTKFK